MIVNQDTLEIYGHVVASNPLGEAYIVPLQHTLRQISDALEPKEISLPDPKRLLENLVTHHFQTGDVNAADKVGRILASVIAERQFARKEPPQSAGLNVILEKRNIANHDSLSAREESTLSAQQNGSIDTQEKDYEKSILRSAVKMSAYGLRQRFMGSASERQNTISRGKSTNRSSTSFVPQAKSQLSFHHSPVQDDPAEIEESTYASSSRATTIKSSRTSTCDDLEPYLSSRIGSVLEVGNYDEHWARGLRLQFENLLPTQRLNEHSRLEPGVDFPVPKRLILSSESGESVPPYVDPPSFEPSQSHSRICSPPNDSQSNKFRNLLISLSITPTKYENPGLLDEALQIIPLTRIYNEADEESQMFEALAKSMANARKPEWDYQDCVVRAMLRYLFFPVIEMLNPTHISLDGLNVHSFRGSTILHAPPADQPRSRKV